ncbi:hypothetical protein K438DRAFT_1790940 [Mycena galopus ATCC 62051]|nr:hypothetical protein K438DRAFT_1790940 [Mycena galopus ATCC 62051]
MTELQLTIRLNFIPWRFRSCPASALSFFIPSPLDSADFLARPQFSYSNRVATYHSASTPFLGDFDPALLPPSLSSYLPQLDSADFTLAFNTDSLDSATPPLRPYFQHSRRMPPTDACAALLNLRPYLEKPGHVYVHVRLNWDILQNAPTIADDDDLDYLDIKVGKAIDMDARRAGYAKCDGEEIIWCFYYKTDHPKLIGLRSSPSRTFLGEVRGAGVRGVGFERSENYLYAIPCMTNERSL